MRQWGTSRPSHYDQTDPDLAKYRSFWRRGLRTVAMQGIFRGIVTSQVSVNVEASPRLEELQGRFVLVANHSSHLDAPVLVQNLPARLRKHLAVGVAADYFFDDVVRRGFTRILFNAFPIDRAGSKKHAGLSARLLSAGIPVLLFPEATRSRSGKIQQFSSGVAALAARQQAPVLPAALIGTFDAMPKGRSWPVPGRPSVTVAYGDPLWKTENETSEEFALRVQRTVAELHARYSDTEEG